MRSGGAHRTSWRPRLRWAQRCVDKIADGKTDIKSIKAGAAAAAKHLQKHVGWRDGAEPTMTKAKYLEGAALEAEKAETSTFAAGSRTTTTTTTANGQKSKAQKNRERKQRQKAKSTRDREEAKLKRQRKELQKERAALAKARRNGGGDDQTVSMEPLRKKTKRFPKGTCYGCGEKGHIHRDCPTNPKKPE